MNLLSTLLERWGARTPLSSDALAESSPAEATHTEFARLEDRTLFSGTPLAEAAQELAAMEADQIDTLDATPIEAEQFEQVSDWAMLSGELMYVDGPVPADEPMVVDGRALGTDADELLMGNDVNGGYGDDMIVGTDGNDQLNGGHGEDRVEGGDGDDLLVSRSDGREPTIAQRYSSADDPDREINQRTRTYYANQPIEGDDVLIGGDGADTFRFEVLINAKPDIILKHVRDDGTIDWGMKGVAGENDNVHDHWVDRLGNEVVWDFSRAEGDKIEVVGHTVDVYHLEHIDSDQDGTLDATVLHVQSNQGNGGGAHNKDQLGTITVFGDLVMESDLTVDAMVNYGIVDSVDQLDEAIAPRVGTPLDGSPPPMPPANDGEPAPDSVFGVAGLLDFDGERDHIEVQHHDRLSLSEGTIALTFTADDVSGRHALFSKDASGYKDGGHLTAFVKDGRIEVRLQNTERSVWLKAGSIAAGEEHHLAVTFGEDGFWVYLDGRMAAWNTEFTQGLETNTENLAIGANAWSRTEERPFKTYDHFDGRIEGFSIYDQQYDQNVIATMAGHEPDPPLTEPTEIDGTLYGTDAGETLTGSNVNAGYGDDLVMGTNGNDVLRGGHGEDRVEGGDGNDLLASYADGREPVIAQNYNNDDDPNNEINDATRTLYPDQPIEADDVLIGGDGADTFYFRTLINAKRDIILKHVNDDGTINWGMNGVAGENNNVHDHWVDGIGNDVIWDFSRAEGDTILIEGHTTEVYRIEHQDSDMDGIIDSTVLHLWSNQGNGGGAHNKDLLGTVTVFGDLVTENDFQVNKVDYGIVEGVDQLEEAITPRVYTPVAQDGTPAPTPAVNDGDLPDGAILGVNGEVDFNGERGGHIEIEHSDDLALTDGTIALTFTADRVDGRQALFSKDASGNQDGGHLTAFVYDGRIKVRLQSADGEVWLRTAEGSVEAGAEHHLTVTFGDDGFWVYLDGRVAASKAEFTQGIESNPENLAIGANTWARNADRPYHTWDQFDGRISGFTVFNSQYDYGEVAELAGRPLPGPLDEPTVIDGTLYGTDADETLTGSNVNGSYGDDLIIGTDGRDMLRGGHGEDRLEGGAGNDLLASYADGREPVIAQNYNNDDDPNNEINDATRTLYPDQPIEADDVLIGGDGADTFYFRTLINAKRDIILKHVNDDGTINWGMNGVAGENNNVHDHWVDGIGDDVIWDFSRAEGDTILIEGHTTEVYRIEHQDSDMDGIIDSTVLHLWSNQGNGGGAHNKDLLGTVTVFGDLVTENDFQVNKVDYGIVEGIDQLEEAITPRVYTPVAQDGTPAPTPAVNDGDLPDGAILGVNGEVDFNGERGGHIEIEHSDDLALTDGTIALTFTADRVDGRQALFSKDASGNQDGGHLTAFVYDGRIKVRLQSADGEVWLRTAEGSVEAGAEHHLTVTFGDDGFWVYLDGRVAASKAEFTQGIESNPENLAIGANTWARNADRPYHTWDQFDGRISGFTVFNSQYDYGEVAELAGRPLPGPLDDPTVIDGTLYGTDADETLTGSNVNGSYGDDLIIGTDGRDMLRGGHGEDRLEGGAGNDLLASYADGREPVIAQNYNNDDDPNNEINDATRTLYPDQPIEADDVLIGGDGADTFYFRTLINAKRDIILKHVNDDGTINWGMNGVAGENNNVHDHWVDGIGDDVIWDFSRAEGDTILIEGHTTEVYRIEHQDSDMDGIIDSTVLHLWSNQGNGGGAHNKDLLGTVTVFGDLVTENDFQVNKVDYGIVEGIDQLEEAITPRVYTPVAQDGTPAPTPAVNDGDLPDGAILGVNGEVDFNGERGGHIEIEHSDDLALTDGTIALTFTADRVDGKQALFSKDASGNQDGGHLTAFVYDGRIKVRLQSADGEVWLRTAEGSVEAGAEHHLTVTFGDDGFWVYLDGRVAASKAEFTQGIESNPENLAIGANTWARNADRPYHTWDHFDGRISGFTVFNSQYDYGEVAELAGRPLPGPLDDPTVIDGTLYGTDADETLTGSNVNGSYGDDLIIGTDGRDMLRGGHGEDRLEGGAGNDLLASYADGREPVIAQNYNNDDDPNNEINDATRTLYPDQPIEADDVLIGGDGADTFYFRTLINAKRDIILKHVNDDGTINWGMNGVAGENNNVHDHWVDGIGNDVIWDFSRAEGDTILIEGHTTEVYRIEHQDSDMDGIIDSTVLHLWSNQGNGGGAHNKDLLGTVTVFGDLVTENDFQVNKVDYGIVEGIDQLEEAITPRVYTPVAQDGTPAPTPAVNDGDLPDGAILGVNGQLDFNGERGGHIEIEHSDDLALTDGTIALTFTADRVDGRQALFSKDASGNQDGGHLTAFVYDGRIKVRLQSADGEVWLRTAEGSVEAGAEHHLTVTFGDDGFWVYLDGRVAASKAEFTQGIESNPENLAIGANTWARNADRPYHTWDQFDGRISGFTVFNSQYDYGEVAELAGRPLPGPLDDPTVIDGTLYGTDADETLTGSNVNGSYGDDLIIGTDGRDMLRGGHGEDRLEGGAGNDLLASYADGREPVIAQNYNNDDDPNNEINDATRTLYPDQPIEADDVLIGGDGADTFYFRTLINAKRDIILKHVNDDGTINWGMNGVAGENNNVHDHWVDGIGNDVIWDFSRAEGDTILIEGHTTEVYRIEHQDSDMDGIIDSTVLHLWSNQGNGGGAHNKDLLGTVTVFGDLVTENDFQVNKVDYGIVEGIDQLEEAITPRVYTPVAQDGTPAPTPAVNDGDLPDGAILGVNGQLDFNGERGGHIEIEHSDDLALTDGTIALTFTADRVDGRQALFSKDASGNQDGGHLTAFVYDGRIKVRLQSADGEVWLRTAEGSVEAGAEHHLTVTFGDDGFWVYLDGRVAASKAEFTQGIESNPENLAIGANTWARNADRPYHTWDHFDGRISGFTVFNSQYDYGEVAELAGRPLPGPLDDPTVIDGTLYGTDADETLTGSNVNGSYGDDLIIGTDGRDMLRGGHGEDRLEGGAGNDLLASYADGREPVIAQNYNNDDDPNNEINDATRTLYPDQPIEADDVLIGGDGADTFYFRTLINAKRDIILKHVNDDGTINWGMNGVAGENNNVHDHWVDGIGNDVIWDFSRAEGDTILIEGHTTEVYRIEHQDSDMDGIIDSTVLHLWSNQGNGGGAHNKDLLGTVTVFGDLVTENDFQVNKVDYGIVEGIDQLEEAITPRVYTPVAQDGTPAPTPAVNDGDLPTDAAFGVNGELDFNGENHIEIQHHGRLSLAEGTIAMKFTADDVNGRHALFSKDASGNADGGHLTAFVYDGRIEVRLQSVNESIWLKSSAGAVQAGEEYHLAVTFGGEGFHVYLNGQLVSACDEFTQGLDTNTENLAIGGNTWSRSDDQPYKTYDFFDGQIEDFRIYGSQYGLPEIATLADRQSDMRETA